MARIISASARSSATNTIVSFIIVVNAITPFRGDGGMVLRDKETGKLYRFPKRLSAGASKLYKSLGLRRDTKPREIISLPAYRRRIHNAEVEEASK